MKKILTPHQETVFNNVVSEIDDILNDAVFSPLERIISLNGPAGSGKSFLTARIIRRLLDKKMGTVKITTTTHKSLDVICNMLEDEGLDEIEASTIHSHLRLKVKDNYDTGEQTFTLDVSKKTKKVDILFIDEYSMISEDLMKYVVEVVKKGEIKCVVFVGDVYQLPPVSGEVVVNEVIRNNFYLTEIARQKEGSPIISLATIFRNQIENLKESIYVPSLKELLHNGLTDIKGNPDLYGELVNDVQVFTNEELFMDTYYNTDPNESIVTGFTNSFVKSKNKEIRNNLLHDKIVIDEFGNCDFLVEGEHITFQETYAMNDNIVHKNNETVIVAECNKKFNSGIWFWEVTTTTGTTFKCVDPISAGKYKDTLNDIASRANAAHGKGKSVIWKHYFDIKNEFPSVAYGYASTIHKTQGSTYENVFFSLRDVTMYERNIDFDLLMRLCYVAITRSSQKLFILV